MEAPIKLKSMFAMRHHRMHHYLFHAVRNSWEWFSEDEQKKLTELGWKPPRPARKKLPDGSRGIYLDNDSGEDFLYMHRKMIAHANDKLKEIDDPNYPKIIGWKTLPDKGNKIYPVPPAFDTGDSGFNSYLEESKSDDFFQNTMQAWEKQYTDKKYLKTITLGELGARIEFTIHNRMHIRWCSKVSEMRPDVDPTNPDNIDAKWDKLEYDWLADTYSSHVHSIFWKLHGWVDDRITDWANANGIKEIKWKGTWIGKNDRIHDEMNKALKIVLKSGVLCNFYDDIII